MVAHLIQKPLLFLPVKLPGVFHPIFFNQLLLRIVQLCIGRKTVNVVNGTEQHVFRRIVLTDKFLVKIQEFFRIRVIKAVKRN